MPVSDPSSSTLSDRSPTQTDETRSTSETPSTGTRPRSPASLDLPYTSGRIRVPAKRARKAINCAPCRQSKLKCDRYFSSPPCSCRSLYDLPLHQRTAVLFVQTKRCVFFFLAYNIFFRPPFFSPYPYYEEALTAARRHNHLLSLSGSGR